MISAINVVVVRQTSMLKAVFRLSPWIVSIFLHLSFGTVFLGAQKHQVKTKPISFISVKLTQEIGEPLRPLKRGIETPTFENRDIRISETTNNSTQSPAIPSVPDFLPEANKTASIITEASNLNTRKKQTKDAENPPEASAIKRQTSEAVLSISSQRPQTEFKKTYGRWQLSGSSNFKTEDEGSLNAIGPHTSCVIALKTQDLTYDRDAIACFTPPPLMPNQAVKSGYCRVNYDINPSGRPQNIEVINCSEGLFLLPSKDIVPDWYFMPKVEGGRAVLKKNHTTLIKYTLSDFLGNIIPGPFPPESHTSEVETYK